MQHSSERKYLEETLKAIPQMPYSCQSRCHRLPSFDISNSQCYVKREDELGFGLTGSKVRKYRTLIPFLLSQQIQEVVVIGSAYSNHVVGVTQLLIENRIKPTLFIRGQPHHSLQGNALLNRLLVPDYSIHWMAKEEWVNVEDQAQLYAQKQPHSTFVLPEGAFMEAAFWGALSLTLDIVRNEEDIHLSFDHLLLDAGTGLMAGAVILGHTWLQKHTHIHVLLLAEEETAFINRLNTLHTFFEKLLKQKCPWPQNFTLHKPRHLASFGSTSPSLFRYMADLARQEGLLTDPIYIAKLFLEAQHMLKQGQLQGNILINHSGGALTLAGFQEPLLSAIQAR